MSETRHASLRDPVRVLRRHRTAMIVLTLLAAGIAAALSYSREPSYVAKAQVTFQEESRSNAEAGLATTQTQSDRQLAAALANEVARGAVTLRKNAERKRFTRSAERVERQYEELRDADQTTRDDARAVKDALAHLPERTTGIVVTGLKPGREHDYGYYSHEYYGER